MKGKLKLTLGLLTVWMAVGMTSCTSSGDNPGIEYAPQMYVSQAYEPYSQEKKFEPNPHGMTMRLPVNGTIARGQLDFAYPHPNTGEGYEAAATYTGNVAPTKANVAEGERLYQFNCSHCHGKSGKNDGPIFKSGKIPGPAWQGFASEQMQQLPVGKMYHTITYGKGLMGSHAHMLNPEQRWKVIHFLKSMSWGDAFVYAEEGAEMEVVEAEEEAEEAPEPEVAEENQGH